MVKAYYAKMFIIILFAVMRLATWLDRVVLLNSTKLEDVVGVERIVKLFIKHVTRSKKLRDSQ